MADGRTYQHDISDDELLAMLDRIDEVSALKWEEHSRRVKEGQAKSAKWQAFRARPPRGGPWSGQQIALRSTFKKGKPLSAWEKICGCANG